VQGSQPAVNLVGEEGRIEVVGHVMGYWVQLAKISFNLTSKFAVLADPSVGYLSARWQAAFAYAYY
jgi:hypothetical protein